MENLLRTDWYVQPPIDPEHKSYILLAFLLDVDRSYLTRKVSPYLLHLEKLEKELVKFRETLGYHNSRMEEFDRFHFTALMDEAETFGMTEIIDFSVPRIRSRIDDGYVILRKYKQVLY